MKKQKRKSVKDKFYSITRNERITGKVVLDIYRIQTIGQPTKIDRVYFPFNNFNQEGLTEMLKRYGGGALRVRHYTVGSKHHLKDFILPHDETGEGNENISFLSENPIAKKSIDPIKYIEAQRKSSIEILNVKNELSKIKMDHPLIEAKIEREKAEVEIMKQEHKVHLKQMEADLDVPSYGDIIKKYLYAVATEKDHPVNRMLMTLTKLGVFASAQKIKNTDNKKPFIKKRSKK